MKLDLIDKKILTYIYHHYRDSISSIAKECNLTKDQINYRLQKYEREKIILKYATLYNYNLLGKNNFIIVWISCKNKDILRKELENMENILTYGDMLSKWDVFINFVYTNMNDFKKDFNEFLFKNVNNIIDHSIFITTSFHLFDLKTFGIKKKFQSFQMIEERNKMINLSKNDIKIFKLLEHDGRMKIIDIAKKTNLSSTAIIKNIRKYKEIGLIQGVRVLLDMEKIGYFWAEIHLKFKVLDEKNTLKIIAYCKGHPHINLITFGIGDVNCIIQIFFQKIEDLKQTAKDIKTKFNDLITSNEIILTENEGNVKTLPFFNEIKI